MSKRPSLLRRMALALMEHAAWVFPSVRGPWPRAMRNELSQIENDLEALTWAGGCLIASYVERCRAIAVILTGAVFMHGQRRKKIGSVGLLVSTVLVSAFWWGGQRLFITPGTHQVFQEDASFAAELAAILLFLAGTFVGLPTLLFALNDRKFREAARAGWVCAGILIPYMTALMTVALLTPRTIVSIGDMYCWDDWCMGVQQVNAARQGENIVYTAEVRIVSEHYKPSRVPAGVAKRFFDVRDERARTFPLLQNASFVDADVTLNLKTAVQPPPKRLLPQQQVFVAMAVLTHLMNRAAVETSDRSRTCEPSSASTAVFRLNHGESLKSSLTFLAPSNARELYLLGHDGGPPWVYLAIGSDLAPFHRRALLRIL